MSQQALSDFKQTKFFSGLDGLRFFSIAAVVWHHSGWDDTFPKLLQMGFLGVDLFFVISGFLIVTLLLRERDKTGSISLRNFYVRRALRIFPLYYGVILGLAGLYFFLNRDSEFGSRFLGDLPVYLFHLSNLTAVAFGVTWSLASEEQFYLVWPCLEKYCKQYIGWILAFFIAVNQAINFYSRDIFGFLGMSELADLSIMQATFTPILLGVLLAHLLHNTTALDRLGRVLAGRHAAVIWVNALIVTCLLAPADISGLPRLVIQCIMALLVGSVVVNENNSLMGVLKTRLIARIGAISYGIYLFHIHTIVGCRALLDAFNMNNTVTTFLLGFVATSIVAELSFRFFESPFLKFKTAFSAFHGVSEQQPAAVVSVADERQRSETEEQHTVV